MDQSEADWGDWSLNNDAGLNQMETDNKPTELMDDEQRLTAYDEEPQKSVSELQMYEDDEDDDGAGFGSAGSGDSEASDYEDLETMGELQKELLGHSEARGPLGLLQAQNMVMCEFCGKLGVRDAFYSKTKRFCSVNCSKSFSSAQKEGTPTPFSLMQASMAKKKGKGGGFLTPTAAKLAPGIKAFDWSSYMNQKRATAAPVSCFKHCLMSDSWDNIAVGMKIEVINSDSDLDTESYWIATVIQLAGYRALLRYEGFGNENSHDFWTNLCSKDVHPVGWCAGNGKPLVPPKTIIHKYLDWKDFLVKRLTGARTLPQTFYEKVHEKLNNTPLKKGMFVEVVDKMCVSAMRVARVEDVIGGRLKLHYVDSKVENDEFWCHRESPLVHPVGWSLTVGHKLHATADYRAESLNKATQKNYGEKDSSPDMFKKNKDLPAGGKFQVGMKLEAIDPLNLSSICVASVTKVLRNNYLMIGIDGSAAENGSDWFCYHATSPCIFPVGFCEINGLDLTPPRDHRGPFKWFDYLKETKCQAAPVKLFDKSIPRHGFKLSMKLEAVDLMEPRLICVASVSRVVGRLLKIHFDGWEDSYDQWVDCQSADIYPVGWCEMVNFHLEGPRPKPEEAVPHNILAMPKNIKKRRSKNQMYRGARKSKKRKTKLLTPSKPGSGGPRHSLDSSDISQDSFTTPTSDAVNNSASKGLLPGVTVKTEVLEPTQDNDPAVVSQKSVGVVAQTKTSPGGSPQKVPVSSKSSYPSLPSAATTATSSITPNTKSFSSSQLLSPQATKFNIPRIVVGEPDKDSIPPIRVDSTGSVTPDKWGVEEIAQFLSVNDCSAQSESFGKKNINGLKFLDLTKEQIVNLTGMKVGPSLKIFDLIQNLKALAGHDDPNKTGVTKITASVLLKQQGMQQSEGGHSELGKKSPSSGVTKSHSLALKAQLTQ